MHDMYCVCCTVCGVPRSHVSSVCGVCVCVCVMLYECALVCGVCGVYYVLGVLLNVV